MKQSPPIAGFFGEYRFLSNFWHADINILGIPYMNVEAAYQASKSHDITIREQFSRLGPKEAKARGRKIQIDGVWNDITKATNMELCLRSKFLIPDLKDKLIATGSAELIEANTWGDRFWGKCEGQGQNILGKILMELREELIRYKEVS